MNPLAALATHFYRADVIARIEARCMPCPACGCHFWTGATTDKGYGLMSVDGKLTRVHRAIWEAALGPIPGGLDALHKCDVRCCANLNHLFLGTNDDNVADREAKGRTARGDRVFGAKLTAEIVRHIRRSHESGTILAERYGVSDTTIYNVRAGRRWRHV